MNCGMPPSRGAKRRGNPHPLYATRKHIAASERTDSHDQFVNWSRNDSFSLRCSFFSLMAMTQDWRPLSRLTPTAPLTGAPSGCGAVFCASPKPLPRSASPSMERGRQSNDTSRVQKKVYTTANIPPRITHAAWAYFLLYASGSPPAVSARSPRNSSDL